MGPTTSEASKVGHIGLPLFSRMTMNGDGGRSQPDTIFGVHYAVSAYTDVEKQS